MPGLEENEQVISDALRVTQEWLARGFTFEASLTMGALEAMVAADERDGMPPALLMAPEALDQVAAILGRTAKVLTQ